METFMLSAEAGAYLDALRIELADLPADERDELLTDVEASLAEAGAQMPEQLLGTPAAFAAELRTAAGLGAPPALPAGREGLVRRIKAAVRRAGADPRAAELRVLAPLWWVTRAYALVWLLATFATGAWSASRPWLPLLWDSSRAGAVMLAAAIAGSVALGLRGRRRLAPTANLRRAAIAAQAILAVATVPALAHSLSPSLPGYTQFEQAAPTRPHGGLVYGGTELTNVYAIDRNGRALYDVRLYGDDGQPLNIGGQAQDADRRLPATSDGAPAHNAFPIRYFEPGTRRVADPSAGPLAETRPLTTPALPRTRPR